MRTPPRASPRFIFRNPALIPVNGLFGNTSSVIFASGITINALNLEVRYPEEN